MAQSEPESEVQLLRRIMINSREFHKDVLPQIGSLAIQNYEALNQLGIDLSDYERRFNLTEDTDNRTHIGED